jgi:hypothetical protein
MPQSTASYVSQELKDFLLEKISAYGEASTEDLLSEVSQVHVEGLDRTDEKSWKDTVRHALIGLRRKHYIDGFAKKLDAATPSERKQIENWIRANRPMQSKFQQIWFGLQ